MRNNAGQATAEITIAIRNRRAGAPTNSPAVLKPDESRMSAAISRPKATMASRSRTSNVFLIRSLPHPARGIVHTLDLDVAIDHVQCRSIEQQIDDRLAMLVGAVTLRPTFFIAGFDAQRQPDTIQEDLELVAVEGYARFEVGATTSTLRRRRRRSA